MSTTNHILPLTSIRFFAAIFVLFSHLSYFSATSLSVFYVKEGFIGVTLFFILSGFVLAYSYEDRFKKKKTTIFSFYSARIARIYPLHILTLILALPFFLINSPDFLSLLSNVFLLQAFIPNDSYYFSLNAPSWSISVEMLFYLLFPLLIRFKASFLISITIILILIKIVLSVSIIDDSLKHAYIYISNIKNT
nr:acyltransferase [uncultured Moellerella sp.]